MELVKYIKAGGGITIFSFRKKNKKMYTILQLVKTVILDQD